MGHIINHVTCGNSELKATLRRYLATAYDPEECSGYHGFMTIHRDIICKNREEAEQMIEQWDTGWYSDHAVRFKNGRKLMWLIKYEYHS